MKLFVFLFGFIIVNGVMNAQDQYTSPAWLNDLIYNGIENQEGINGHEQNSSTLSLSRNNGDRLDSLEYWVFDTAGVNVSLDERSFFTYDANGNTIGELVLAWDGSAWVNSAMYINTFYDGTHPLNSILQFWNGSDWENSSQVMYGYDGSNHLITITDQTWDGSAWKNNYLQQYTYAGDLPSVWTLSTWNFTVWKFSTKHEYYYENHRLIQQDDSEFSNQWDSKQRRFFEYSGGNLVKQFQKYWYGGNNTNDHIRYTYEYNSHGDRILQRKESILGKVTWQDIERYIYDYDSDHNLISELYQVSNFNHWFNKYQLLTAIDENHNRSSLVLRNWKLDSFGPEGHWVNEDSTKYYYTIYTGVHPVNKSDTAISLYPNPVRETLHFDSSLPLIENMEYEILSDVGLQCMKSSFNVYPADIEISNLLPGIYTLVIRNKNGAEVKKFIKL